MNTNTNTFCPGLLIDSEAYQQVSTTCISTLILNLFVQKTKVSLNAAKCNPSEVKIQMMYSAN